MSGDTLLLQQCNPTLTRGESLHVLSLGVATLLFALYPMLIKVDVFSHSSKSTLGSQLSSHPFPVRTHWAMNATACEDDPVSTCDMRLACTRAAGCSSCPARV